MRHATGGGGTRENPRRGRFDYVITTCVRAREERARRGWSREPKNGTPRLGVKYLGALLALTVALTGPAPPVCFCASERGREAPRRDARGGCPTPVRPRWRPRLGSSRCARVLRLPRRDERARSPGSPSTQNPASSVVAVGGSDAGIPDRVAPFPGSRLTPDPHLPRPQRRKRYSEAGVLFTDAYLARVEALPDGPRAAAAGAGASATADDAPTPTHPADAFKRAMRRFTTLGSTYAEMESLQELIDILVELAGGPRARAPATPRRPRAASDALPKPTRSTRRARKRHRPSSRPPRAYSSMLFLSNSRPIHRHLITSARRFPPAAREAAERALDEEVASALARAADDDEASGAGRMRPLAALASVNGCQPQTGMEQRVLRRAAVPAAALVARGAPWS